MKTCCVVVIGHVDHGKTALVRALTGTDADRLPEEKARGLSITPGFAYLETPQGTLDLVDAPGHADFVQAMVSGASGAQAALVVISAVEGVQAQTLEHLRIAALLGIDQGVIALSMADRVTPDALVAQEQSIRAALSDTPFHATSLMPCSAHSGIGIAAVQEALTALIPNAQHPTPALHPFLPIDRVFTLPGRGTVVTGTLLGQALSLDTPLELNPGALPVTLRGLQSRGEERTQVQPGERTAANLRGISPEDLPRGAVLCAPEHGPGTQCVDVLVEVSKDLKPLQDLRVLFSSTHSVAQVRLFNEQSPRKAFAQLRFPKLVACFAGQRAILRQLSPPMTLGRATFLDPRATAIKANNTRRVEVLQAAHQGNLAELADAMVLAGDGAADLADVARLARLPLNVLQARLGDGFAMLNDTKITTAEQVETTRTALIERLTAYHQAHPLHAAAPRARLAVRNLSPALLNHAETALLRDGTIKQTGDALALATHDPLAHMTPEQSNEMTALLATFKTAGLAPPVRKTLQQSKDSDDLLQLLLDTGQLIPLQNIALKQVLIFHPRALLEAAQTLLTAFPNQTPFATSEARSALNTSRRVIVPLLEYFDQQGLTQRDGDTRQMRHANLISPGPRPC